MISFLPTAMVTLQLITVADTVPDLDLTPTCSAAREMGVIAGRTKEACVHDENDARDRLRVQWAEFPAADRTRCTQSTSMGGVPSYVEMLTCLEIAKQARTLPAETVGRAPSTR